MTTKRRTAPGTTRRETKIYRIPPVVHRPPALSGVAQNLYALQQDLEVARRIQDRLLCDRPQVTGYDFDVLWQPAGEVGGDFFDFVPFGKGRLGIIVADASGKGLAGALLMVEARAVIRAMASIGSSPGEILLRANRVLVRDLDRGMFVTIFLTVLDPIHATLSMVSAGHTPILLWRAGSKKCSEIQPRGLMLGAAGEEAFAQSIAEETDMMEPGDRFLLYSDGVPELMNPVEQEFGMERLKRFMTAKAHVSSADFVRELADELELHRAGQPQSDDITIVTGRMLPE